MACDFSGDAQSCKLKFHPPGGDCTVLKCAPACAQVGPNCKGRCLDNLNCCCVCPQPLNN
ncbi:hypothetical protein WN943_023503 [Citrus x changshan-huyou]